MSTDDSSIRLVLELFPVPFDQLRNQFADRCSPALILRPVKCNGSKELPSLLWYVDGRGDAPMAIVRFWFSGPAPYRFVRRASSVSICHNR